MSGWPERACCTIWLGTLLYLIYAYLVYAMAVHLNALFLVYVAVLSNADDPMSGSGPVTLLRLLPNCG